MAIQTKQTWAPIFSSTLFRCFIWTIIAVFYSVTNITVGNADVFVILTLKQSCTITLGKIYEKEKHKIIIFLVLKTCIIFSIITNMKKILTWRWCFDIKLEDCRSGFRAKVRTTIVMPTIGFGNIIYIQYRAAIFFCVINLTTFWPWMWKVPF